MKLKPAEPPEPVPVPESEIEALLIELRAAKRDWRNPARRETIWEVNARLAAWITEHGPVPAEVRKKLDDQHPYAYLRRDPNGTRERR